MRTAVLVLLTAMLLLGLGACQKTATSSASTKPFPAWPGKIVLATDPPHPVSGQGTIFRVTLTDAAGQPVSGAKVEADLKMQTMDMGTSVVQLMDKGNGVYEGKGQFSMAGPWNVIVSANKAGTSGAQNFEVAARK